MFHLILFVAFLYPLFRGILPLKIALKYRLIFALILFVFSSYHLILRITTGNMFSPEVPRPFVMIGTWGFVFFFFLFVTTVILDLINLLFKIIRRRYRWQNMKGSFILMIYGAIACVVTVGMYNALQLPQVNSITVKIKNLPPAFENYRIIQLSDLHISRLFDRNWSEPLVEQVNALNPDLILITGDLIDGFVSQRVNDIAPLAHLKAKDGVITILGNHEYYFNAEEWQQYYPKLGMTLLANQNTMISKNGDSIAIAGIIDEAAISFGLEPPNLEKTLAGIPTETPVILLKHQPKGAKTVANHSVDLQLSGHTHGGMIAGFNQLIKQFNEGYVSGEYQVDEMILYVNNGTALWGGFPIRLGVPAEITEITLTSQ